MSLKVSCFRSQDGIGCPDGLSPGILSGGICLDRNYKDLLVRRFAGVKVEQRFLSSVIDTAVRDFVEGLKRDLSSTSDDPFEELQLPFDIKNLDTGESEPRMRLNVYVYFRTF